MRIKRQRHDGNKAQGRQGVNDPDKQVRDAKRLRGHSRKAVAQEEPDRRPDGPGRILSGKPQRLENKA